MLAVTTLDWKLLLTIGVLIALAMVLTYRLMHKDSSIRRTKYGFFIERDRFEQEEAPWPEMPTKSEKTLSNWGDQANKEG